MKRFTALLCLISILALVAAPVSAQTEGEAYQELSSDAYRQVYRLLEEGIASMAPVINFPEELGVYYKDLPDIARAVCLDHPEYFWFLESWYYEYESQDGRYQVTSFTPTYYLDNQQVSSGSAALADAMVAFHSKVDEIITGIPVNCTSDYDIALYLHDYLAQHVTYTLEGDHDSAYSALIHGEAACYGYSKAYQYLLTQAGVRSRIIVGESVDPDGTTGGHAWNQVWIDGECYYTDVTWDDMPEGTFHQFFLMSLEQISDDHIADDLFTLPECSHSMDYFRISEGPGIASFTSRTKAKEAAPYFRLTQLDGKKAVFACELRFEGDFEDWLNRQVSALADALELSYSTQISYYYFQDVYYLILTDSKYDPSLPDPKDMKLNLEEVTLAGPGTQAQLTAEIEPASPGLQLFQYTSEDASVAVAGLNGMITAVAPGTTTIRVTSADGSVSAYCKVTVTQAQPHVHDMRSIAPAEPTCTLDGNIAYYQCKTCAHRFSDAEGTRELTDVSQYAIAATGHVNVKWIERMRNHVQVCECGEQIPNTTGNHEDGDKDGICDICGLRHMEAPYSNPVTDTYDVIAKDSYKTVLIWVGVLVAAAVLFLVIKRRR